MPPPDSLPAPGSGDALIVVEGVSKRCGEVEALRGLDLTVRAGEMFAFPGPNGAGPTPRFSTLATLRSLTAGRATLCGHDVTRDRAAPGVSR